MSKVQNNSITASWCSEYGEPYQDELVEQDEQLELADKDQQAKLADHDEQLECAR